MNETISLLCENRCFCIDSQLFCINIMVAATIANALNINLQVNNNSIKRKSWSKRKHIKLTKKKRNNPTLRKVSAFLSIAKTTMAFHWFYWDNDVCVRACVHRKRLREPLHKTEWTGFEAIDPIRREPQDFLARNIKHDFKVDFEA